MTPLKNRSVVIIGVALLAFLSTRLFFRKIERIDNEKEWFRKNLDYRFSARVDSTVVFNQHGNGFMICSVTSGKVNANVEDSLNRYLEEYKRLKFVRFEYGKLKLFSGVTNIYKVGDSVYIDSEKDLYRIMRKDEILREYKVSNAIDEQYF